MPGCLNKIKGTLKKLKWTENCLKLSMLTGKLKRSVPLLSLKQKLWGLVRDF